MKKFSFLIVLFALLLCFSITSCNKTEKQQSLSGGENTEKTDEGTDSVTVKINFPVFADKPELSKLVFSKVNIIQEQFNNECVNSVFVESNEPASVASCELIVNSDEVIEKDGIISFIISCYKYTGGANGETVLTAINYDVLNKKEILLKDVFKDYPENWLEKLASETNALLKKQLRAGELNSDEQFINDGTEPNEENFSVFKLEDENIRIFFSPYQVGPRPAGTPNVVVPLNSLK